MISSPDDPSLDLLLLKRDPSNEFFPMLRFKGTVIVLSLENGV